MHQNAEGGVISVQAGSTEQANKAIEKLIASGVELDGFAMESASLEEVFFALTGHGIASDDSNGDVSDQIVGEDNET